MPENCDKQEIESSYIESKNDLNALDDLSSKMCDLFSNNCIKILKILIDKPSNKFFDATEVNNLLKEKFNVSISKQATRVHLENLVVLDLLFRKKAVIERNRGKRSIIAYEYIPNGLKRLFLIFNSIDNNRFRTAYNNSCVINKTLKNNSSIINKSLKDNSSVTNKHLEDNSSVINKSLKSNDKENIKHSNNFSPFHNGKYKLTVLNGVDRNKCFYLKEDREIKIGKIGNIGWDNDNYKFDIKLSNEYKSISMVSQPHGIFKFENGHWHFVDKNEDSESYINIREINSNVLIKLKDKDVIQLSLGKHCVYILFSINYY